MLNCANVRAMRKNAGAIRQTNAEKPRRGGKNPPVREEPASHLASRRCSGSLPNASNRAEARAHFYERRKDEKKTNNVGFCTAAAHTLAGWAKRRTQRRHAAHVALRAFDTPAGSIVPIVFTGGKSALLARLSEIHRLPLLRQVSARTPFSLRAATLSRTNRVTFLGVMPRLLSGSIFADSADGEPRYVESARSNSEKSFVS